MMPLFDLEPLAPSDAAPGKADSRYGKKGAGRESGKVTATTLMPVPYWIRGVFRFRDSEERTRTVEGVGMSAHLADDTARFVDYLRSEGWLFPEGRAMLVEPLGIAAEDGGLLLLGDDKA